MTVPTIIIAITGVFGEGGSPITSGTSPAKDQEALKKWSSSLTEALKKLAGKAVDVLSAFVGNVAGAVLKFRKAEFVAENTWILIVFVAELIGLWIMGKVKKLTCS